MTDLGLSDLFLEKRSRMGNRLKNGRVTLLYWRYLLKISN